jgi:hypothetical protein
MRCFMIITIFMLRLQQGMEFPSSSRGAVVVAADTKYAAFKAQIQDKIQHLLSEFSEGKINREQFHAVYEHYNGQLSLIEQAMQQGVQGVHVEAGATIAIRQQHMGKAIGLVIYHNRSGMLVDTLGEFDVPPARIAPILNDFSLLMESNERIERRVEKVSPTQWLLFAAGRHTTVVTLFHNEPSQQQSREIERLHNDFERANTVLLEHTRVDASRLAYPFLVFVQQKLKKQ